MQDMNLLLNTDQLLKEDITPDEYVFLYYLYNKIEYPFPKPNIQGLQERGFLKDSATGISLRDKTNSLFSSSTNLTLSDFVDKYRSLFPQGVKEGYPFRGDRVGCMKKLEKFFKNYPDITQQEVLDATKAYIDRHKQKGFTYLKQAHYFIEKNGVSDLAAEIEFLKGRQEIRNPASEGKVFL